MDFIQSLATWLAMDSVVAGIRAGGAPGKATPSRSEEVFVPFNLPPVKPEPTEEARPPVAVLASSSETVSV